MSDVEMDFPNEADSDTVVVEAGLSMSQGEIVTKNFFNDFVENAAMPKNPVLAVRAYEPSIISTTKFIAPQNGIIVFALTDGSWEYPNCIMEEKLRPRLKRDFLGLKKPPPVNSETTSQLALIKLLEYSHAQNPDEEFPFIIISDYEIVVPPPEREITVDCHPIPLEDMQKVSASAKKELTTFNPIQKLPVGFYQWIIGGIVTEKTLIREKNVQHISFKFTDYRKVTAKVTAFGATAELVERELQNDKHYYIVSTGGVKDFWSERRQMQIKLSEMTTFISTEYPLANRPDFLPIQKFSDIQNKKGGHCVDIVAVVHSVDPPREVGTLLNRKVCQDVVLVDAKATVIVLKLWESHAAILRSKPGEVLEIKDAVINKNNQLHSTTISINAPDQLITDSYHSSTAQREALLASYKQCSGKIDLLFNLSLPPDYRIFGKIKITLDEIVIPAFDSKERLFHTIKVTPDWCFYDDLFVAKCRICNRELFNVDKESAKKQKKIWEYSAPDDFTKMFCNSCNGDIPTRRQLPASPGTVYFCLRLGLIVRDKSQRQAYVRFFNDDLIAKFLGANVTELIKKYKELHQLSIENPSSPDFNTYLNSLILGKVCRLRIQVTSASAPRMMETKTGKESLLPSYQCVHFVRHPDDHSLDSDEEEDPFFDTEDDKRMDEEYRQSQLKEAQGTPERGKRSMRDRMQPESPLVSAGFGSLSIQPTESREHLISPRSKKPHAASSQDARALFSQEADQQSLHEAAEHDPPGQEIHEPELSQQ